ncbi:hypothetical protein jhhlp_002880 [Lomentospora prolificans]|uniref:Delta(24)-sterol reductase n=1 Tax=Lomentospora prolificans TaxID=41688 RepID=A0A2N3NFA3_9PEZI|nr:hypothetical protein jhhlp_002880 [Lomentospora prolificans]
MDRHASEVSLISSTIAQFYKTRTPFRVYHGSTNSTRPSGKTRANIVDTSRLNNVLSVDTTARIAVVEPNVPMDKLVRETVKYGVVPPVIMEFPGITAGGGFSGTSGESSSFRYGPFEATVEWIEIVLADGEVTRASAAERADLFRGAASAFGTMGVITLLGIRLVEARELVRLEYHWSRSFEGAVGKLREETGKEENQFVDAITFAMDSTITCAGRMVDGPVPKGEKLRRFTRRGDPWFYLHVEEVAKKLQKSPEGQTIVDYIPLADYYFRYDRGAFWTGRYAFKYFITPFNRVTRRILDPLLHTRVMYGALHKSGLAEFYLTQDVAVPFDRSVEFQNWMNETYGIYPVWLCPLRVPREGNERQYLSGFWNPASPEVINFGVWGPMSFDKGEATRLNRLLEAKLAELGGRKCLYAQTYYTQQEFWANYDREAYNALREKYRASHLPSVYDKVKPHAPNSYTPGSMSFWRRLKDKIWDMWPVRGLYGVFKVFQGGDYLLAKDQAKAETIPVAKATHSSGGEIKKKEAKTDEDNRALGALGGAIAATATGAEPMASGTRHRQSAIGGN